jgi:hypothetical protein
MSKQISEKTIFKKRLVEIETILESYLNFVKDLTKIVLSFLEESHVKSVKLSSITPKLSSWATRTKFNGDIFFHWGKVDYQSRENEQDKVIVKYDSQDKNYYYRGIMCRLTQACPNGSNIHKIETATFRAEFSTHEQPLKYTQSSNKNLNELKDSGLFLYKFTQLNNEGKEHGWNLVWDPYCFTVEEESYYQNGVCYFKQKYDVDCETRIQSFFLRNLDNYKLEYKYHYDHMRLYCYLEDDDDDCNYLSKNDKPMQILNYKGNEYNLLSGSRYKNKVRKIVFVGGANTECITSVHPLWKHVTNRFPQDWRQTPSMFDCLVNLCENVKQG